jgi:hypothetical protein
VQGVLTPHCAATLSAVCSKKFPFLEKSGYHKYRCNYTIECICTTNAQHLLDDKECPGNSTAHVSHESCYRRVAEANVQNNRSTVRRPMKRTFGGESGRRYRPERFSREAIPFNTPTGFEGISNHENLSTLEICTCIHTMARSRSKFASFQYLLGGN